MKRFVGVDIGGTNTDLILVDIDGGRLVTAKVPTTADNQADGLIAGIDALGIGAGDIDLIVHGTTVATNAAIERKGARCGLITTHGFRDVLELRRRDRPHTYGLEGTFEPLIPRYLRREVAERVSAQGEVLVPLDEAALRVEIQELIGAGCEALVICFLHSYLNPEHERAAQRIAREIWPNDYVVTSIETLPTLREFERTSAAAVSAYVQPLIGRYLERLSHKLREASYRRELLVVQSNGGVMSAPMATRFAANTILSGPAAGVTAASAIAGELGLTEAVSCDMGGTSLDICVIHNGVASLTQQKVIDFGIPLALPMLDVDAIGAGGGSIARIDAAGILQVGPESAGSQPGPACYGRGGTEPTVTDASLLLGLLDPDTTIGVGKKGGLAMDRGLARAAIVDKIAVPLGLSAEAAAEAILTLTGAKMAGHVRRKLLERGLDPRTFSMIAFGGAGPVHANRILREVGLARAVIPLYPGITSALGCILGRLRHDFLRTVNRNLDALTEDTVTALFDDQAREGIEILEGEGHPASEAEVLYSADMSYVGQPNVIAVSLRGEHAPTIAQLGDAFRAAYLRVYGKLLDERVGLKLVNVRTSVSASAKVDSIAPLVKLPGGDMPKPAVVTTWFDGAPLDTCCYARFDLPAGAVVKGPALLLQPDSTCFVEPGYRAVVQPSGHIYLEAEQ